MFTPDTRLLIVDDSSTMRKIIARTFLALEWRTITEASSGNDAWTKIEAASDQNKPFQLIISDWNMPEMTGIDLLRSVRESVNIKGTPFILVTAEAEVAQVKEAIIAGVDGYVTKPFSAAVLMEQIKKVYLISKSRPTAAGKHSDDF